MTASKVPDPRGCVRMAASQRRLVFRHWQLAAVLALLVLVGAVGATLRSTDAEAAADPVVWVNDYTYGSAGKGFYHDFVSGTVWTSERGWHMFSPQPPRPSASILWVNYLSYGSASGGFYLDSTSGQVWTSERGWHSFQPLASGQAPAPRSAATAIPTRKP